MRRTSWILPVLLLFAAILAPTAANATTYMVNQTLPGGGSITGSITTTTSSGTLGYIEIFSWSFGVSDGFNTGTSNPGSGAGHVDFGDFSLSPTGITLSPWPTAEICISR